MFNGRKIAKLEESVNLLTHEVNNHKYQLAEVSRVLKEISLALPEMTDTINLIRKELPKGERANAEPNITPVEPVNEAPANRGQRVRKDRGTNKSR